MRSIYDGATLQVITETRLVDLHIDEEALDQAFEQMATEERLSDEEKEVLARKATRLETLLKAPERITRVCQDIVEHYATRVEPLGLKAMVVAYDRELCVLYQDEIARLLAARDDGWESTVVMTTRGKDDPEALLAYERDRAQEAEVKRRFRTLNDPLKIVIVTAKWLTGFDAKNLGVMYLDKPLRAHTLFQAITRTNRTFTNPLTRQEKTAGLVIDYIGLGAEIAKAVQIKRKEKGEKIGVDDVATLQKELRAALETVLARFDGIDRASSSFAALMAAQERLSDEDERDDFAREFLVAQALYEFLDPDTGLSKQERLDYRWVAKVYQSVQPAITPDALLWQRLGAKTHELIAQHIGEIEVGKGGPRTIVLDGESLEQLKLLGLDDFVDARHRSEPPTAADVMDSIRKRLEARGRTTTNPKYRSLAERLEALRQTYIENAEEGLEFLKQLLEIARELVQADKEQVAEEGAGAVADDSAEARSLLPEQRVGALTQIFEEFRPDMTPEIVERVVHEIDAVVMGVRFTAGRRAAKATAPSSSRSARRSRSTGSSPPASSSTARTPTWRSTTSRPAVPDIVPFGWSTRSFVELAIATRRPNHNRIGDGTP